MILRDLRLKKRSLATLREIQGTGVFFEIIRVVEDGFHAVSNTYFLGFFGDRPDDETWVHEMKKVHAVRYSEGPIFPINLM